MYKNNFFWASFFGATGVILGAFATHALAGKISAEQIVSFQTGVRYQFYHSVVLLFLGLLSFHFQHKFLKIISILFIVGIFLFSGSIYLLNCRELLGISSWKWLGPLTPLGGLCFITGWVLLFFASLKMKK